MKSLVATLILCALAYKASAWPIGNPDLDDAWEDFIQRYNKHYDLDGEEVVTNSNYLFLQGYHT